MRVAVPKEITPGEFRVALTPDAVSRLVKSGNEVTVESGAGAGAWISDDAFRDAGGTVAPDVAALYESADVVLKVQRPMEHEAAGRHEADMLTEGCVLIAFLQPMSEAGLIKRLADNSITAISMDAIPRIARAQSMDALSSMASISGYRAALIAADSLPKFFPMMITAAGSLAPAKGLVLGAGVAGLQAIATAHRLGAVMYGYDIRPAVGEQVRSLGATFVEANVVVAESEHIGGYARELTGETQQSERELIHQHVAETDFVISTAAVPGKPAPTLVTEPMVRDMRPGSVIVDLAAETGGNCELTEPGRDTVKHGVTIRGPLNLPSSMPVHASQMYSRNISTLLRHISGDGRIELDLEDEIVKQSCIAHSGSVIHEPTLAVMQQQQARREAPSPTE